MFELTSAQYRFRCAVPEGDLYEALGLSPKATSLDADVAGARLAEHIPSMAQDVSRVVNVLTHRRRKALYDVVRRVRDEVADLLASRYGPDFSHSIPDFRRDLWERCSRLFRFDLAGDEQKLGENGRQALAGAAPEWIVRGLLDAHVTEFAFESREGKGGRAWRDEWHARCRCPETASFFFTPRRPGVPGAPPTPQDGRQADPPEEFSDADYWEKPPTCPRCRERYRPIQFDDRYVFVLPARLARGDVLRGESVAGGSPTFVVVGSPTGLEAPKALLERFFALQNEGNDVTLAEAQRDLRKRPPVVPKRSRPSQPSPSGSFPAWNKVLGTARNLLKQHGVLAALRSKNLNLLGKARCVLLFLVGLAMFTVSVYFLWDSYDFLLAYKATQGSITTDPKRGFSGGGGPLNHTAVPETHVEYSFAVDGCRFNGSDTLSGDEARKFDKEHSLELGAFPAREISVPTTIDASGRISIPSFPSRGITVFYDRNNPSRNRASLPEPFGFWFGLAFGLVLSLFPTWLND